MSVEKDLSDSTVRNKLLENRAIDNTEYQWENFTVNDIVGIPLYQGGVYKKQFNGEYRIVIDTSIHTSMEDLLNKLKQEYGDSNYKFYMGDNYRVLNKSVHQIVLESNSGDKFVISDSKFSEGYSYKGNRNSIIVDLLNTELFSKDELIGKELKLKKQENDKYTVKRNNLETTDIRLQKYEDVKEDICTYQGVKNLKYNYVHKKIEKNKFALTTFENIDETEKLVKFYTKILTGEGYKEFEWVFEQPTKGIYNEDDPLVSIAENYGSGDLNLVSEVPITSVSYLYDEIGLKYEDIEEDPLYNISASQEWVLITDIDEFKERHDEKEENNNSNNNNSIKNYISSYLTF